MCFLKDKTNRFYCFNFFLKKSLDNKKKCIFAKVVLLNMPIIVFIFFLFSFVFGQNNFILIDSTIEKQGLLEAMIAPYRQKIEKEMSQILGYNHQALEKPLIGQFAVDALLYQYNQQVKISKQPAQIAFLKRGNLRRNIDTGFVHVGDIYELMPFENRLVGMRVKGADLICLGQKVLQDEGFYLGGMEVFEVPFGVFVAGKKVKNNQTYHLATIDYLALGGDNSDCFKDNSSLSISTVLFREALIDEVKRQKDIRIVPQNRIHLKKQP